MSLQRTDWRNSRKTQRKFIDVCCCCLRHAEKWRRSPNRLTDDIGNFMAQRESQTTKCLVAFGWKLTFRNNQNDHIPFRVCKMLTAWTVNSEQWAHRARTIFLSMSVRLCDLWKGVGVDVGENKFHKCARWESGYRYSMVRYASISISMDSNST